MNRRLSGVRFPFLALTFLLSTPLEGQDRADTLVLRYKPLPQPLKYEVNVATEFLDVAQTGMTGRWDATHLLIEDVTLEVGAGEAGELSGRYDFKEVQTWRRTLGNTAWGRSTYRDTRFRISPTGELEGTGSRPRWLSGDEIFRRLWEVPHVLPEAPVQIGATWRADRSIPMSYSHSTEIECVYTVAEVLDQDVWIEFSGTVNELLRGTGTVRAQQTGSRGGNEGSFSGRFGFRPSLGAAVVVEWDYEHRQGNLDRPWEYREFKEVGSMVLRGLSEEVPVRGVERIVPETKDDKRALRHGLVIGGVVLAIGLLVGFVG